MGEHKKLGEEEKCKTISGEGQNKIVMLANIKQKKHENINTKRYSRETTNVKGMKKQLLTIF